MPRPSPPLLNSNYDDIATRVEKLAVAITRTNETPGWVPPADDSVDLGRALISLFATMARHGAERINRIPERNFLAFLARLGLTPSAARAARVPLTFSLVPTGDAEPTVPGRTRVGANAQPGDTREVIFETERDLFTTRAQIASVFVRQPDGDRLANRTAAATGASEEFYQAFDGGEPATHTLYLAADDVLTVPAETNVTMTFSVNDAARWAAIHGSVMPALTADSYYVSRVPTAPLVRWTYWNGTDWADLKVTVSAPNTLRFNMPANMTSTVVNGRRARWIRARLLAWPLGGVPSITGITIQSTPTRTGVTPSAAFANTRALDLSMDFYPFGETPHFNDFLLLSCDEWLARPGANLGVQVTLNNATQPLKSTDAPILTWEISTATGWKSLTTVQPTGTVVSSGPPTIRNDVLRTTMTNLVIPADAAPMTIGNVKATWLRIRLSGGSFGVGLKFDYTKEPPQVDDGYRPPIVQSISMSSTVTLTNTNPLLATENDLAFADVSLTQPLVMFSRSSDDLPTLYAGFDRAFTAGQTQQLYVQVAPLDLSEATRGVVPTTNSTVNWEYWAGDGTWKQLAFQDKTRGFIASDMVSFVAPGDMRRRSIFSRDLFWLRARYRISGPASTSPRIGRMLTNTVWARDCVSSPSEILGSADGRADASFTTTGKPILDGQTIAVRESSAAKDVVRDDMVEEDDPSFLGQIWVRWVEVDNFDSSGPKDRHYAIDREGGIIRFGDGLRGMAPPRGKQNVRARYAFGGGAIGNRPAKSVAKLKTTVPYVAGVTNFEPATGGANADTGEEIKSWGPSVLRHGYRAVTAEDFEDLALEASPAVARAKTITIEFDSIQAADTPIGAISGPIQPGSLVLLLATNGPELPPAASAGILRDVDAYLRARSSAAVDIRLAGPTWVEVSVLGLDITASSAVGTEILRDRIQRGLAEFFHPITGNVEGQGWNFGDLPNESDVYRFVMSIPGVSRIGALDWTLRTTDGLAPPLFDDPLRNRVLIYPGRQNVRIVATGGA